MVGYGEDWEWLWLSWFSWTGAMESVAVEDVEWPWNFNQTQYSSNNQIFKKLIMFNDNSIISHHGLWRFWASISELTY